MKKQVFKFLFIGLTTITFLGSCNKENVSQEDVITNQQVIDLALRIVDASNGEMPIDSAVVEIVDGSAIRTATSDETGMVYFEDIAISNSTPVYVKKSDYITIATDVYTIPDDYRQVQVTETIKLYPLSGDNLATIVGRLTIETNVTNRVREAVPAGSIVRAYNYNLASDIAFIDSTDAQGNYEIKVPVEYTGNDYIELVYPEIYTNQRVAIRDEHTYAITVVDRPAYFNLDDDAVDGAIPALPSVSASIAAPPAASIGSGFAMGVKAIPTAITDYSTALLISGGSGYNDGNDQLITLSSGIGGTAQLQVDIANESIVNIDGFIDNGALYTSAPSINTSTLGGTGAEIDIQFEMACKFYITNNGSGYVDFPYVTYEYTNYSGTVLRETTTEIDLSDYTNLSGGKIVNENFNNVDTIAFWTAYASLPVVTVVNTPTQQMYISFDVSDIDDAGQISDYNNEEGGYGYNVANPPALTLTALAGYGSGAVIDLDLTTTGVLSSVDYVNRGTGYVKNVNDFTDNGITWDYDEEPIFSYSYYYDGFRTIYNVKPGAVHVRSAHYGTGNPNIEN